MAEKKRRNNCSKRISVASDICAILNLMTVLLMTIGSGFIMRFIGLGTIPVVICCFVLFWVYAWIEEHHLSRFINTAVEKIMKIDIEKKESNTDGQ